MEHLKEFKASRKFGLINGIINSSLGQLIDPIIPTLDCAFIFPSLSPRSELFMIVEVKIE